MGHRSYGVVIIMAFALAGCASDRSRTPLLTAGATARIAKTCGAVRGDYQRDKPRLPYATFVLKADEVSPDDGPSPTVRCLGHELDRYRHAMFGFRTEGKLAE